MFRTVWREWWMVASGGGALVAPGSQASLCLTPCALSALVLCSNPDFACVPRPAIPALAGATIAQPVPCEKM